MKVLSIAWAVAAFAGPLKVDNNLAQEDVTIRSKSSGPALSVPPPTLSKPVIDEVLKSLDLGRGEGSDKTVDTIHVTPNAARFRQPFPEPPFLALSPENIRATYDSWTFEIREADGDVAQRAEGVGILREGLDWDGAGADGRLEVKPGRRYFYRFTGQRGPRQFVVESDPVLLNSFTRREYGGETRLEAAIEEIFVDGKIVFATGAERYLNAMAEALRAGEARPDGTYRFELYARDLRAPLTQKRIKVLTERLGAGLAGGTKRIRVSPMTVERSEALAAFIPPSKGPTIQRD